MGIFSKLDFGMLQTMLYPVIHSITGVDIQGMVADKADVFAATADGLEELAELFRLASDAAADGIITNAEFEAIVEEAEDLPGALEVIQVAFNDKQSSDA